MLNEMKQIKVEHTRTHNSTLIVDAELVLVQAEPREPLGRNWVHINRYNHYPILISRTEKIEVGDWYYTKELIRKCGIKTPNYIDAIYNPLHCFKVLALPEHFSPEQLQDIVDGKLKEGKILVECEVKHNCTLEGVDPCITDMKLCEVNGCDTWYQIYINSSNHITLHKIEEKMYMRDKLIGNDVDSLDYFLLNSEKYTQEQREIIMEAVSEWFEQNVK